MSDFTDLLRRNRNYRYTWFGQVVSEVGDHFNNIAVFSLVMSLTGSGKVVSGVLLARGLAMLAGGPLAGVLLDRFDRRQMMIGSDLFRAAIAFPHGPDLIECDCIARRESKERIVFAGCFRLAATGSASESPVLCSWIWNRRKSCTAFRPSEFAVVMRTRPPVGTFSAVYEIAFFSRSIVSTPAGFWP